MQKTDGEQIYHKIVNCFHNVGHLIISKIVAVLKSYSVYFISREDSRVWIYEDWEWLKGNELLNKSIWSNWYELLVPLLIFLGHFIFILFPPFCCPQLTSVWYSIGTATIYKLLSWFLLEFPFSCFDWFRHPFFRFQLGNA